ncbi:MAG: ABC transporter permease, partial [bacterium]
DLWRLNEARLQILRSKDIRDSAIEELHGRAEDVLLAAQAETQAVRRDAMATCSFLASQPVYRSVRTTLDDLVFAVLILLLLSIPFSFVLERVIVGATTIYRQLLWFGVFFILTFLLLYETHPAFAIAGTPMILFLGFAVMGLSTFVIVILMRRFDAELKAMQGIAGSVHTADVSRISTLMAAMHMGVSTLRRRPLRTALTATTITLLTLTILCFASFGTQRGLVRLLRGPSPEYTGVWLHDLGWGALSQGLADVIEGRWSRGGFVCRRMWVCSSGTILSRQDGSNELLLRGVVGFEQKELSMRQDLAAVLGTNLTDTILLTKQTAQRLGIEPGETAMVNGLPLRVGRLPDAVALSNLRDMDGGSVLPVDLALGAGGKVDVSENSKDPTSIMQVNWTPLPADSVAVVSAETASKLRAILCGIAIYTPDTDSAGVIADDLARTMAIPVSATLHSGVYFHGLGVLLAASGASDLFFPILLGGLVIFGTMLGSVADREREIYTFSALGLAPRHVAMLFFAEAMVYSLLGGMGGYLLAQGTIKIMTILSHYGLAVVPEMNVSSTNTIITILIVMGTVLVSAIYPALKASRSANPGLM